MSDTDEEDAHKVVNDHQDVPVHYAKKGERFCLPKEYGVNDVFIFDHMDGMYCFARSETTGQILNWCGPVVLVDKE